MKVLLAGYNIDTDIIEELSAKSADKAAFTPETISAAYARISRSPKPIDELRKMARQEVDKSRRSNKNIIFNMGHHSIAEHAVFNFDIMGISRLAMEEIEKFRLSSFTEKSQRYITLEGDYVTPAEIDNSPFKQIYSDMIKKQNKLYHELYRNLKEYVFKKNAELAIDPKKHDLLDGWAKEDARYITSLGTEGQVGQTINARNLELLFRRFASSELSEIRELGQEMFKLVEKVAPSIILFTEANDFDKKTYPAIKKTAEQFFNGARKTSSSGKDEAQDVKLVNYTFDADNVIVATILHSASKLSFDECLKITRKMNQDDRKQIIKASSRYMELYDPTLREYEYVNLTFELVISASCFAQLKRHRLASIICQDYDPQFGLTIPASIDEISMTKQFKRITSETEEVYDKISKKIPAVAKYILTNAHRKRVLIRVNARELYHISRLREDTSAQWDIRQVTHKMVKLAKEVMPLTCLMIGGKDSYPQIYEEVFGQPPKVGKAGLPG
jgi:flavin-dependent thymidylate synthase